MDFALDQYKMQQVCNKAIEEDPWSLEYIPDLLKTKEMHKELFKKIHTC